MSFIRQIGYLVSNAVHSAPEKEQALCATLEIGKADFQKLCAGRLFLAPFQMELVADSIGVPVARFFEETNACDYREVVHCMTPFTDVKNRDLILDLIDAYIDAKEVLCAQ